MTLDTSTFKKEDVLGNILLKISDKTMSVEEFGKVRYRVYLDGEMVLENTGEATEEAGGYACCGLIMYLEEKQVGLAHVTPGLYLPISEEDLAEEIEPGRCFYEFYFPSVTTGELKTIGPKYLPASGRVFPVLINEANHNGFIFKQQPSNIQSPEDILNYVMSAEELAKEVEMPFVLYDPVNKAYMYPTVVGFQDGIGVVAAAGGTWTFYTKEKGSLQE